MWYKTLIRPAQFTLAFVLALWLGSSQLYAHGSSEYDDLFIWGTARFLEPYYGRDWYLLKAQAQQESLLDAFAVSHAGAVGLMQFMPGTWRDCQRATGISGPRTNPRASVACAGWYMRYLLGQFSAPRPEYDRRRWAWSAYNCGLGCTLSAQKRVGGDTRWYVVEPELPRETQTYVHRIEYWWRKYRNCP